MNVIVSNKNEGLLNSLDIDVIKTINGEYHDRCIDIDLLKYDNLQMKTDRLTLPHPLIQERDFVRIPLSEIE